MSFNPGSKSKTAATAPSAEAATSAALPFLQCKAPTGAMIQDPAKAERSCEDARKKTMRTLNAIKIVAPVLSAVTERHGGSGSEEEAVSTFKRLVSQSSEMSELVIRELGEDPNLAENFWLRNMLERSFCEVLKDQIQRGKEGTLKPIEGVLREIANMEWSAADGREEFVTWGAETVVRAALLRACAPIMIKAAGFNFFRADMSTDMEAIMKTLMGAASRATLSMSDPHAGERERASLFSVLIGEAGNLYASAWHACGKQMVNNMSSMSDKDLKTLLAQHPEGLPLDKINDEFERNFTRLVSLSVKLVPQKAGRIETRMKSEKVGSPS